jgi:hypothetical protein
MRFVGAAFAVAAMVSCFGGSAVRAADEEPPKSGCDSFTWDVSHELAVLDRSAKALQAGRDAKTAPRAEVDVHYVVALAPQGNVKFPAKPGKRSAADGAHAGIVTFHTGKAGRYRISTTTGHWLDVLDGGNFVVSRDFQGQRGCEKVHKIVEFELSGNRDFIVQLSGGADAKLGLAITQVARTN